MQKQKVVTPENLTEEDIERILTEAFRAVFCRPKKNV